MYSVGSIRKTQPQSALSNRLSKVGVSPPPLTLGQKHGVSKTYFVVLDRIMDDGQSPKTSNTKCYTQSSKPFRIYMIDQIY
jgi:hypothetical protein